MLLNVTQGNALRPDDYSLAAFAFGNDATGQADHPAVGLLGASQPVVELWQAGDAVNDRGRNRDVVWRATPELLFGSLSVTLTNDAVAQTRQAYGQLLDTVLELGYPHLVRIWNYVPAINQGAGDRECYKDFSLGRAQALESSELGLQRLPAATAVGTAADAPLQLYFIASRQELGQHLENPRQVSAYDYPRQYGPRSPLFSRATLLAKAGEAPLLLVSGTASIVGHESRHVGDLRGQLLETWRNLEEISAEAGTARPLNFRVYLRHRQDYQRASQVVAGLLPADVPVVFLQADLCRCELLVEMEGTYTVAAVSSRGTHC